MFWDAVVLGGEKIGDPEANTSAWLRKLLGRLHLSGLGAAGHITPDRDSRVFDLGHGLVLLGDAETDTNDHTDRGMNHEVADLGLGLVIALHGKFENDSRIGVLVGAEGGDEIEQRIVVCVFHKPARPLGNGARLVGDNGGHIVDLLLNRVQSRAQYMVELHHGGDLLDDHDFDLISVEDL